MGQVPEIKLMMMMMMMILRSMCVGDRCLLYNPEKNFLTNIIVWTVKK